LQGVQPCVPCRLEGCERHIASFSDCLQQLPVARVIAAVDEALESMHTTAGRSTADPAPRVLRQR
jgi:heptosyltransferase III